MESASAAKAAVSVATLSQRRRRCATQRREIFCSLPIWNSARMVATRPRDRAIAKAATRFNDPKVLLEVPEVLTGAMRGLAVAGMDEAQMLQTRAW